jgi:hypothetical protein
VLSGKGLCSGPLTLPEESEVWCDKTTRRPRSTRVFDLWGKENGEKKQCNIRIWQWE